MAADSAPNSAAQDLLRDPLLKDVPTVEGFKVLDPAVLYARVGQGGMGAVYRGRHFKLDLDVAVKCLKPSLAAEDAEFVWRFQREARIAASIAHQNVVRVMDVQERNGLHYLVMEFVRGETAAERVKRKGPLKELEALAILLGATAGLAEAHKRGVVHRDIKPENLMVSMEGCVKLADLGLAKMTGGVDGRSLSVVTSRIMGTPQYMPPEQWETTDVTPAADVWALGASFYYLLAGRHGISGAGSLTATARQIQDRDYPTLRAVRPDLRPEVHAMFECCVQRDPKERYPDARALLRVLRQLTVEDDDVLLDPETGTGVARASTLTPPPKGTLLRIKSLVETQGVGAAAGSKVAEPAGKRTERATETPAPTPSATAAPARDFDEGATRPSDLRSLAKPIAPAAPASTRRSSRRAPLAAGAGLVVVLGLVYALASSGSSSGSPADSPSGSSSAAAPPDTPAAPTAVKPEARAAFERGMEALPLAASLDAAIRELEKALSLDPSLTQAKEPLAHALDKKAERLAASDPDQAFQLMRRAAVLQSQDEGIATRLRARTDVLVDRLRRGITLSAPAAEAVLGSRQVALSGQVTAPKLKALRATLALADAAATEFPADAPTVSVVAGALTTKIDSGRDGQFLLRLQAEDQNGVRTELPPVPLTVDTLDPVLTITSHAPQSRAPRTVVLQGKVADVSPCRVEADGQAMIVAADGQWRGELTLSHGERSIVVTATDRAGRAARTTLALRVDAEPPMLRLGALPAATNRSEVAIEGTVQGIDGGSLLVNGAAVTPAADGTFVATVALPTDQNHTLVVVATDAVGNVSKSESNVRRHTVPPVLQWQSPDPTKPVPAGEVEISGAVLGDLAGSSVTVNGTAAEVAGTVWRAKVRIETEKDARVEVAATDAAGNAAKTLAVTLRGAAPVGDRFATGIGLTMLFIKPTMFQMGSPAGERGRESDESLHEVTITTGYWIGETEVTRKQWRDVLKVDPRKPQARGFGADDSPITNVSWNDAVAFCEALTEKERALGRLPADYAYMLPSEAQWELACRAGATTAYSHGDDGARLAEFAVIGKDRKGTAEKVKRRKPNTFGLYDMHGNVWEWTADAAEWVGKVVTDTYVAGAIDPLSQKGSQRVVRGGCWSSEPAECRAADRVSHVPGTASNTIGFRVVLARRAAAK